MDTIGSALLAPWLSCEDREKVRYHSKENFVYVKYLDNLKGKTRIGMLNEKTKEVMWAESPLFVRFKQFLLLTICHIPYAAGHLLMHPIKCTYHVARDLFSIRIRACVKEIAYRVYGFVRTFYYMVGMAVALSLGVLIDPIKGREAYGLLDFHHNGDIEFSKSYLKFREKAPDFFTAVNETEACYFAQCMQPWTRNFDEIINCVNDFKWPRYEIII